MSLRERAEVLFYGYNAILAENGLSPYSVYAFNKARPSINKFLKWCAEHGVDPLPYARGRLEAAGWGHRIPFSRLASAKFLKTHEGYWADKQGSEVYAEPYRPAPADDALEGPALHVFAEGMKAMYAKQGLARVCHLDSATATLGWNPKSRWCAKCEVADRCKKDLPHHIRLQREHHAG